MISIVICTSNRAEKLHRCIHQLVKNTRNFDPLPELIVVDNNSYDDTRKIIESFCNSCCLHIKYIFEIKQGLSFARNAGVREAAFPVVAFTDDDCVPDRNWITAIHQEFQADPSLAILGGRVEPLEPSDKGLGMRQVSQKIHIESYDLLHHFMIGCNVAIHHKVFEAIGPFDTGLGRGTLIDSGEDRDFLYRALKQGFKIVCSPESLVYHGHGRHTEETIQNCKNTYAQGRGAFYCKHITARDFVILRKALSETFDLIKRGLSYRFQDMKKSNPWTVLRYLTRGAVYQLQRALSPRRKSIPNRTR